MTQKILLYLHLAEELCINCVLSSGGQTWNYFITPREMLLYGSENGSTIINIWNSEGCDLGLIFFFCHSEWNSTRASTCYILLNAHNRDKVQQFTRRDLTFNLFSLQYERTHTSRRITSAFCLGMIFQRGLWIFRNY